MDLPFVRWLKSPHIMYTYPIHLLNVHVRRQALSVQPGRFHERLQGLE